MPNATAPASATRLPGTDASSCEVKSGLATAVPALHALVRLLEENGGRNADDVEAMYVLAVTAVTHVRSASDGLMRSTASTPAKALCDLSIIAARHWQDLWRSCVTSDEDPDGNDAWSDALETAEQSLAAAVPRSIEGVIAVIEVLAMTNAAPLDSSEALLQNALTCLRRLTGTVPAAI